LARTTPKSAPSTPPETPTAAFEVAAALAPEEELLMVLEETLVAVLTGTVDVLAVTL